jgi:hypothetical protein
MRAARRVRAGAKLGMMRLTSCRLAANSILAEQFRKTKLNQGASAVEQPAT